MVRFFRVPFFFFVLVSFHYTEYRNLTTDRPDMGQPREPKQRARRAWYRVTRVRVTCVTVHVACAAYLMACEGVCSPKRLRG